MKTHHRSASPYEDEIGFARALRTGRRILVSGTAPIDPQGEAVQGDAYTQAQRCFAIAVEAVEALGGRVEDVVRTRMFLTRAEDWREVGRAHGEFFRGIDPVATMVVVKELLDPVWKVEIEVEAEVEE